MALLLYILVRQLRMDEQKRLVAAKELSKTTKSSLVRTTSVVENELKKLESLPAKRPFDERNVYMAPSVSDDEYDA